MLIAISWFSLYLAGHKAEELHQYLRDVADYRPQWHHMEEALVFGPSPENPSIPGDEESQVGGSMGNDAVRGTRSSVVPQDFSIVTKKYPRSLKRELFSSIEISSFSKTLPIKTNQGITSSGTQASTRTKRSVCCPICYLLVSCFRRHLFPTCHCFLFFLFYFILSSFLFVCCSTRRNRCLLLYYCTSSSEQRLLRG